jgi:hypothetical protein
VPWSYLPPYFTHFYRKPIGEVGRRRARQQPQAAELPLLRSQLLLLQAQLLLLQAQLLLLQAQLLLLQAQLLALPAICRLPGISVRGEEVAR